MGDVVRPNPLNLPPQPSEYVMPNPIPPSAPGPRPVDSKPNPQGLPTNQPPIDDAETVINKQNQEAEKSQEGVTLSTPPKTTPPDPHRPNDPKPVEPKPTPGAPQPKPTPNPATSTPSPTTVKK